MRVVGLRRSWRVRACTPASFARRESGKSSGMSRLRTTSGRGTASRVISGIGAVFALIEVIYILMLILDANTANAFFRFIAALAEPLALFFPGLFQTGNNNVDVLLNYGLAAVFWLVVTGILARLVYRY